MPTATLDRPAAAASHPVAAVPLQDSSRPPTGKPDRVDESAAVIKGVKVLGVQSKNTGRVLGLDQRQFGAAIDKPYRYSIEGLREALPLYEGAKVFSNHTKFDFSDDGQRIVTGGERQNEDLLGWLRSCRIVETGDDRVDGLYADLHYLKTHPFASRLVEVAKRNDRALALSHEAGFDSPRLVNGVIEISRITEVNSVALVASPPGTTAGLFEDQARGRKTNPMTIQTIRQIVESLPQDLDGVKQLREAITDSGQFNQMADMPVPTPDERQADPNEQLKRAMLAAINSKLPELNVAQMKGVMKACGLSDSISETIAKKEEMVPDPAAEVPPETPPEEPVVAETGEEPMPVDPNAPPVPPAEEQPVAEQAAAEAPVDPNAVPVKPEEEQVVTEGCATGDGKVKQATAPAEAMATTPADEKVAETAADSKALVLECVGLLTNRGLPVNPTVLEAMLRLERPELREQFAGALLESAQRELPAGLREPKSAPSRGKPVQESTAPDPRKLYEQPGSFARAIQSPRGW